VRAAILLAGGRSRRFIGGNKLLAKVKGRALLLRALDAALAAPVARVIVVTGSDRARVARCVGARHGPRLRLVHARDHREGIAGSLRAGLAALRPCERALFVFLGDMPDVPAGLTARMLRALKPGVAVVRPSAGPAPGHPVLIRRPDRSAVAALRGDRGLSGLLSGRVHWIETPARALRDVDRRRDLRR
jgi:molybdenum cofactor cytidylyltransferase